MSKSAAAQLNSSKDIGSVWVSVDGKAIFGLLDFVCQRGTITGKDCSSDDGLWETAVVVSILVFLLLVGYTNSDNMGNKEFRDSFFSVNDRISLCRFPIVDAVRVVFLLYYMNSMPKTIKHTPVVTSNAKINLGDKEKG